MGVAMTLNTIEKLGGGYNDLAYLSQPSNWKWRILTPNSVSLYVTSIIKTSENQPVVVEVPPVTESTDIFGTIMDSFQVPLTDIGSSGADLGKGAKYLILPASYDEPIPDGFIPVKTERKISTPTPFMRLFSVENILMSMTKCLIPLILVMLLILISLPIFLIKKQWSIVT